MEEAMSELDPVEQEEVSTRGKNIFVGEEKFEQKIVPPDPTKVLAMSLDKLNNIMAKQVKQGKVHRIKNNYFTGYTFATAKFEEIQDVYMKIRLNHAEARHIVCAWHIPGSNILECLDGCDDEDLGVSRALVSLLKHNEITHRAIYVVRVCGEKLNQERMPTYLQVAADVINQFPNNELTRTTQKAVIAEDMLQPKQKPVYASRGRGRGRGRARGQGRGLYQAAREDGNHKGGRGTSYRGRGRGGANLQRKKDQPTLMQFLPHTEAEIEKQYQEHEDQTEQMDLQHQEHDDVD